MPCIVSVTPLVSSFKITFSKITWVWKVKLMHKLQHMKGSQSVFQCWGRQKQRQKVEVVGISLVLMIRWKPTFIIGLCELGYRLNGYYEDQIYSGWNHYIFFLTHAVKSKQPGLMQQLCYFQHMTSTLGCCSCSVMNVQLASKLAGQ